MRDQHVIACLQQGVDCQPVVDAARRMAESLNHKGLVLLTVVPTEADKAAATEWIAAFRCPYMVLTGRWEPVIAALPTRLGAILAVGALDADAPRGHIARPADALRLFRPAQVAYLLVPPAADQPADGPKTAALAVDHRREGKERFIWASYLVRFCGYRLAVGLPDYSDAALRQRRQNGLQSLRRLFDSLALTFTTATLPGSLAANPDLEALRTLRPDLLVAMTTDPRERDILDHLAGPPERRLVRQAAASATPLLLLNQRDDLYVLCD